MCIRLHHCESFWTIIKSSPGGRPSAADGDKIRSHACGRNVNLKSFGSFRMLQNDFPFQQLICCPDNAIPITTTTTTTTTMAPSTLSLKNTPQKSDLNEVRNHRNINLVNVKCGSSSTIRIVNGEEAKQGEIPWMALLRYKLRLENTFTFSCGGKSSFEIRGIRSLIKIFFQVRSSQIFTF